MSIPDPPAGAGPAIDHRRLLAEIDAEVRERREEGDLPAGFERELDALFNRFAPPSISDDFDAVLERADQHAYVDADAPVASRLPGGTFVKKVLRKLMSFYVQHVARNVTAFASTITRAVKLLGGRVDRLEAAVPGADPRVLEAFARLARTDVGEWVPAVVELLATVEARVAVLEAGDGALLRALATAGVDAYGVDADTAAADELADAGLEVRADDVLAHLRRVPEAALGAVVLVGCVERLPVGALVELASLAPARVQPGGRIVVVSPDPAAARGADAVAADLAPARPLRAATWVHLLEQEGVVGLSARGSATRSGLQPVPGDDAVSAAVNANVARLDELLFPPSSYLVTGTRAEIS
ncbi:MAG: methionine biosynthesis protein MetW [Acidimicrobiia bacterium]